MSTGSIQHRAKHRSCARRLTLLASVVLGLTLAIQWSYPFESTYWSSAQAEEPSASTAKVQTRIVDFATLAKEKAEARQLMAVARKAAERGDFETARWNANQAASIPVEWNLGEIPPKKFLKELETKSKRSVDQTTEATSGAIAERSKNPLRQRPIIEIEIPNPTAVSGHEVIELSFPEERPGTAANPDEDLSLADTPTALAVNGIVPSHSEKPQPPKTLRKHHFAPIPSLAELADSAPEPEAFASAPEPTVAETFRTSASGTTNRSNFQVIPKPQIPADSRGRVAVAKSPPLKPRASFDGQHEQVKFETIRQAVNDDIVNLGGRVENIDSAEQSIGTRSRPLRRLAEFQATPASPATMHPELRIVERTASADQAANLNSTSASQSPENVNGLLMAGIFVGLLLLIAVVFSLLIKSGRQLQFTLKLNVNHPCTSSALAPTAAFLEPVAASAHPAPPMPIYAPKRQIAVRSTPTIPNYAQLRQTEEELVQQQEGSIMRQFYEDNLKLREQLEETPIAA